jgi:hypothetical protein
MRLAPPVKTSRQVTWELSTIRSAAGPGRPVPSRKSSAVLPTTRSGATPESAGVEVRISSWPRLAELIATVVAPLTTSSSIRCRPSRATVPACGRSSELAAGRAAAGEQAAAASRPAPTAIQAKRMHRNFSAKRPLHPGWNAG